MNSFITGSRVYGTPTEDSDIDLVILVSPEDSELLWDNRDEDLKPDVPTEYNRGTLRYGNLNIIAIEDSEQGRKQFEIWRSVTEDLKKRAPVTKEEAIAAFDKAGRTFTNLGL